MLRYILRNGVYSINAAAKWMQTFMTAISAIKCNGLNNKIEAKQLWQWTQAQTKNKDLIHRNTNCNNNTMHPILKT